VGLARHGGVLSEFDLGPTIAALAERPLIGS
jgi:hypothetical protein